MTENPFEALGLGGEGGFDLGGLLAQAQAMQTQMAQAQANLEAASFDGEVAGVVVTVSGTGELRGVRISSHALSTLDQSDLDDLGDVVVAAYRQAKQSADLVASAAMGALSGGLAADV